MSENAKQITLVLPGLFSLPQSYLPEPRLPALELMLARGNWQETELKTDIFRQLAKLMGLDFPVNKPLPVAALSLLGAVQNPENRWCLCADPIQLMPNRDHLLLLGQQHLQISETEADALLADLNRHFADDGLQFFRDQAHRWLLISASPFEVETTPLHQALGQNVRHILPQGKDAGQWRAWLNEGQMVLHQHPVNEQRRQQGLAEINSLWFWGEGRLPASPDNDAHVVWGDGSFVRGLARWGRSTHHELPDDASSVIEAAAGLVVFPEPGPSQGHQWYDDLASFERNWCRPLVEALKQGRYDHLRLVIGHQTYRLTAKRLRRFWRRPRPFHEYCQGSG